MDDDASRHQSHDARSSCAFQSNLTLHGLSFNAFMPVCVEFPIYSFLHGQMTVCGRMVLVQQTCRIFCYQQVQTLKFLTQQRTIITSKTAVHLR